MVGLYPLLKDNSCYFLAADFDKGCWQEEVKAMSKACQEFDIPHAIEISRSGNGVDADDLSTTIGSTDTAGFNPLVDIAF